MNPSLVPSGRSLLTAGVSAALVSAAVTLPVTAMQPAGHIPPIEVASFRLSAAVTPTASQIVPTASNPITEAYDSAEPWVAYGFEVIDYALSVVPGLWWIAPGVDLAYFSIEPLVQATVYSASYVLFGQFDQIPPAINNGFQEAASNFAEYGLAWIGQLIPVPPIPPFPPLPGASAKGPPASSAAVPKRSAAAHATSPQTSTSETTASGTGTDVGMLRASTPVPAVAPLTSVPAVANPADVGADGPRRPNSRTARSSQISSGIARTVAAPGTPGHAGVPAWGGAGESAGDGTSVKSSAARASRAANRAR